MPLVMGKKNLLKSIAPLLGENEELSALLIHRGMSRDALVITNQKRVLCLYIPIIGNAQSKEEIAVDDITLCDYFPGNNTIELRITGPGHGIRFTLPVSHSRFPIKQEFRAFVRELWSGNPGARPGYLEKNENIIETIQSKHGIIKLTEHTMFLFKTRGEKSEEWEIQEKIPFNEIEEFDYYPESPTLLHIYIENNRGESRIFKIDSKALYVNDHQAYGTPDSIIENIYESLSPHRKTPSPTYIHDGEEVLTTCQARGSDSGAVASDTYLRVTSKRIIELFREKKGSLVVNTEYEIDQCENIDITKTQNNEQKGNGYLFRVRVAEDKEYDFFIDKVFQYAVDKLASRFLSPPLTGE